MNDNKFIRLPPEKIADFCRRNRIRKLSLFGSALKDQLRKDSDIDLLVEFQPGEAPSLLDLARMERELSTVLDGRKIDLRTLNELSRYFRRSTFHGQCPICGRMTVSGCSICWNAANEALTFIQGKIRSDLDKKRMLVLSLIRELEIIGEAASKVSPETRSQTSTVPWQDITGMRNRLIHAYVDLDSVWSTVTKDLPVLKAELQKIL